MQKVNSALLLIDASNILAGGGKTHLVELIRHAEAPEHGFDKVIVYGHEGVLREIPPKPWLEKVTPALFAHGYLGRLLWKVVARKSVKNGIWFVPGAGTAPGRYVTMCQNLLPIDKPERDRYFFSLTWVRLVVLGFIYRITFQRAAGVIFLNKFSFDTFSKFAKSKIGKTAFIPHGVSEIFNVLPVSKGKEEAFRLIYVSTIDVYKHQWKIAEAVNELLSEGYAICIDFIGTANPPSLKKLEPYLSKAIHYHGPIPYHELPFRYAEADAFIFGSTCETFGMVLLEAMACGLPVLSSNKSSMPETLGEHALYFDPLDVAAIRDVILKVYKNDSLRKDMQEKGINYAKQFTWEKTSQDTFRFIQDCCK